ncbi:MAG: peptidylprolyl isomerase [Bdellovibrionales bacterium]|nr:peptidylprolyl isomerase [Bdellovibrionales bacterium]
MYLKRIILGLVFWVFYLAYIPISNGQQNPYPAGTQQGYPQNNNSQNQSADQANQNFQQQQLRQQQQLLQQQQQFQQQQNSGQNWNQGSQVPNQPNPGAIPNQPYQPRTPAQYVGDPRSSGTQVSNTPSQPEPEKAKEEKSVRSKNKTVEDEEIKRLKKVRSWKRVYAVLETSLGVIKIRLFNRKTPRTVDNFVGLAEGTKEYRDEKSHKLIKGPFYNKLTFHRVIPDYIIQAGDPLGTGRGGPGFIFEDEFNPLLKHNKPGMVSMANSGPNTNGSQFFITLKAIPDLDYDSPRNSLSKRGNTVFGQVVEGMDIVKKISEVPRDNFDKPFDDIVLNRVVILRE